MENTLENKAAFFAQYWGMNILRFSPDPNYLRKVSAMTIRCPEDFVAILTPLSQITDEDIDVIDMPYISIKDHLFNDIISQFEADYLRSKGYAVPWRDLSVDDLVKFGWVKLKDNEKTT